MQAQAQANQASANQAQASAITGAVGGITGMLGTAVGGGAFNRSAPSAVNPNSDKLAGLITGAINPLYGIKF